MSEYKLLECQAIAREVKNCKSRGCGVLRVNDSYERNVEVR